jgi:hypothetical protein
MKPKSAMFVADISDAHVARTGRARVPSGSLRRACAMILVVPVIFRTPLPAAEPGTRPADALLRLVPPDAAVVLTLEGLRDQVHAFTGSRLAAELWRLPAVRAWLDSEKYRQFERSRAQIEALLGTDLTKLRDELLGDAAVLALRLPPEDPVDASQARGLLLIRARDLDLLQRLIRVVNTTHKESGELAELGDRQRSGTTYHIREFPAAAARPPEWYVAYPDGTFAFSNSELLIQAVIDRKTPAPIAVKASGGNTGAGAGTDSSARIAPGLGDLPKLRLVDRRLPDEPALMRLFVDPMQIRRLLAAARRPSKPSEARLLALLERYLAAVDYAGAALVWSDRSIVLHTVETLDSSRLDPWLRRWAGEARRRDPALERIPSTALALVSGHVDFSALYEALSGIVPDEEQPKLTNVETILSGLLLGHDLRSRILPQLGPGVLAYLDTPADWDQGGAASSGSPPGSAWPFPLVVAVSLGGGESAASPRSEGRATGAMTGGPAPPNLAAALENALRTILAFAAMDDKRQQARSRIVSRVVGGATLATLDPAVPFASAVDSAGSRLVVGTSPVSVARYLESSRDPNAGERFRRLRSGYFPGDETFLCLDLNAFAELAGRHRDRLVQTLAARKQRAAAEVDRDVTHVSALARVFEAAFVTSRFEPDATSVKRRIGLIVRSQGGQ